MVSTNSSPPLPLPMQVPPGHMVQQIIDQVSYRGVGRILRIYLEAVIIGQSEHVGRIF
jgi:hypothetical protein